MRRVFSSLVGLIAIVVVITMVACGGSSKKPAGTTSGLTHRVFVSNTFSGSIEIVNGDNDALSASTAGAATNATFMAVDAAKTRTLVFSPTLKQMLIINNSQEAASGSITLPLASGSTLQSNSIAISPDGNTGYVAGSDVTVSGQASTGAVLVLDLANNVVRATIPVPLARTLALSPDGAKLLAFSESVNSVTLIANPSAATTATVTLTSGMDRPVSGVFSADSTRAYVINCGAECGGTQASVTAIDITQLGATPPAAPVSGTVNVNAGTVALLTGSTIFVAGTPAGSGSGVVTPIALAGNALPGAAGAAVGIGNGFHNQIALGANNKLFVGANGCTTGCLSIFDTAALTAVVDNAPDPATGGPKGSVTGMAALPNRNVVYVVSGGILRVYDTASATEVPNKIIITGQVYDAKVIY